MPTAVASAMVPQLPQVHHQHDISPKSTYTSLAQSSNHSSPSHHERRSSAAAPTSIPTINEETGHQKSSPEGKRASPQSARAGPPPKIIVKKEPPSSPVVPATARHRPRKLDLTTSTSNNTPGNVSSRPSAPLTARDSGSLGMHDVGLACLSPGFQTQDPSMREQLQRSISVRDQQRHIIESRLQKNAKSTDSGGDRPEQPTFGTGLKTPMTSKKRPPPGLSIVPPSHEQFANERVIQSAPLNQTFTGRHQPHPLTRHTAHGPTTLSNSSHIHHVPAMQTHNRLPPITDVFANEGLGINRENNAGAPTSGNSGNGSTMRPNFYQANSTSGNSSHSNIQRPFPSPGLPPPSLSASHQAYPPAPHTISASAPPARPREYRSAEEAVAEMTSGREDLLPKIVHYGGHQPPTPPSPGNTSHGLTPNKQYAHVPNGGTGSANGSATADSRNHPSARRRARAEYERDMGTPPLGSGPSPRMRMQPGPFGEGRDSPETNRRKKEEFLALCSRAWELFHS